MSEMQHIRSNINSINQILCLQSINCYEIRTGGTVQGVYYDIKVFELKFILFSMLHV